MKVSIGILLFLASWMTFASMEIDLDPVDIDLNDKVSLQRGGKLFVDYCQGCHSIKHMRYSRIAKDFGLAESKVSKELIIGAKTINDSMTTAMNSEEAKSWFLGIGPPDLSLVARSRGADWLYTYLRGFYLDPARPFGVNNIVYPDVAMPNVFGELQGYQKAVFKTKDGRMAFDQLANVESGKMTTEQFDQAMTDLVNFLVYAGEPAKLERVRIGKYVILYLLIFLVFAYLLKKEFWKDVH